MRPPRPKPAASFIVSVIVVTLLRIPSAYRVSQETVGRRTWLLVLAIAVFTLAPIEFRPVTAAPVSLKRFTAFAAIGATFCLGCPKHRLSILVLLLGIVGFLEVAQNYVPGHHGRLPDGLVKASGAHLGAAFAAFISRDGGLLRETGADEEL
jgi:VanZ family protein